MSAAADWSLTPQTVARVAGLETPPGPIDVPPAAESALESDPTRRLGVDCCARCAAPDPATSCERCARVRYCSARCASDDAATHAPACPHLAFAASLDAESGSPSRSADDAKSAAAAVREVIANLKLLGADAAAKLLGPRGYRREEEEDGEPAAASADAVKPRWRAVFKLSSAALAEDEKNAGAAIAARRLVAHAERLSDPLSVVAASWMFPVVKYALMLGGRRADDDPEGDDGDGDPERDDPERDEESLGTGAAPAEVHVILPPSRPAERAPSDERVPSDESVPRASEDDDADSDADADARRAARAVEAGGAAWWLVGFGCDLPRGARVTLVGPAAASEEKKNIFADDDDAEASHRRSDLSGKKPKTKTKKKGSGKGKATSTSVRFAGAASYAAFAEGRSEDSPGPCVLFAPDLLRREDPELVMRAMRRAGCPAVTSCGSEIELAMEAEAMEEEGFALVGMERNPFPHPAPRRWALNANHCRRTNEWVAAYVPTGAVAARIEPSPSEGGGGEKKGGGEKGGEKKGGEKRPRDARATREGSEGAAGKKPKARG